MTKRQPERLLDSDSLELNNPGLGTVLATSPVAKKRCPVVI